MTEREKLEKVIKGLELCGYQEGMPQCDSCPYDGKQCWKRLKTDALALLKAQEARVVKISELTSGEPMLVWLEDIDKKEIVAGMIFDYVPGRFGFKLTDIGSMDRIYPRIEDYLTRWRCWTSRPTDEQREAVKWELPTTKRP